MQAAAGSVQQAAAGVAREAAEQGSPKVGLTLAVMGESVSVVLTEMQVGSAVLQMSVSVWPLLAWLQFVAVHGKHSAVCHWSSTMKGWAFDSTMRCIAASICCAKVSSASCVVANLQHSCEQQQWQQNQSNQSKSCRQSCRAHARLSAGH